MREPGAGPTRIEIRSYAWPEVTPTLDLAALVIGALELADGDVLVLTSKVVSKAEGLVVPARRADVVDAETTRVVARRGPTVIARTRHGLTMAAAGVDASNVPAGAVVRLPLDPDESARLLRARLYDVSGRNAAVVVTDTAGRPWRNGQTDIAIGCAGLTPLLDLAGMPDQHGNLLSVTAPAVADELAGAGDLVKGKTRGRPLAVVRGLEHLVLPAGEPGPGAAALIRSVDDDLFGLGARDAVHAAALRRDELALAQFPNCTPADPEPFEGVGSDNARVRVTWARDAPVRAEGEQPRGGEAPDGGVGWLVRVEVRDDAGLDAWLDAGRLIEKVDVLAAAHRLRPTDVREPSDQARGWRTVARTHWSVA